MYMYMYMYMYMCVCIYICHKFSKVIVLVYVLYKETKELLLRQHGTESVSASWARRRKVSANRSHSP